MEGILTRSIELMTVLGVPRRVYVRTAFDDSTDDSEPTEASKSVAQFIEFDEQDDAERCLNAAAMGEEEKCWDEAGKVYIVSVCWEGRNPTAHEMAALFEPVKLNNTMQTPEFEEWEDWYEKYSDVFQEETGYRPSFVSDGARDMARRHFDKGNAPVRAAKEDAHFMLTGE